MRHHLTFTATLALAVSLTPALPARQAFAAPARQGFDHFFEGFRAAVLAGDKAKVATMTALPFKDFASGEVDRSAATRAQFLARYEQIFTPAVIAAIRSGKVRAFKPGSDDGEAPGPLGKGEYLLDAPDEADQLVFSPKNGTYVLSRVPFYS
jgi:hypothetical protein